MEASLRLQLKDNDLEKKKAVKHLEKEHRKIAAERYPRALTANQTQTQTLILTLRLN